MMSQHAVSLPFRGDRKYITGVDLLEQALLFLEKVRPEERTRDIRLACYRMLHQSNLAADLSATPLSKSEYAAIVQVDAGGLPYFLGWRADEAIHDDVRVPCLEARQLAHVQVGEWRAEIAAPADVDGSLLTMLVAAIKATSKACFPDLKGKWIFAGASLMHIPVTWSRAIVSTRVRTPSAFYNWTVDVDGEPVGSIMFFLDAEG